MKPSEEQLLEWNRQGLIPGPDETEDQYIQRVNHCLNLKQELKLDPGFIVKQTEEILTPSFKETHQDFDIVPHWIPVVFGNKHLAPWHGGCAWIFQLTDNGPLGAFIQLRKAFLYSPIFLGLYKREELIAHELCHAGRMAFEEPKYEEIIAYSCSKRSISKTLGPLVESSTESMIFLLTLVSILAVQGFSLFYEQGLGGDLLLGLLALPFAMILYASIRLFFKIRSFRKCKKQLQKIFKDPIHINGVTYRLTDKEIEMFGKMSPTEIRAYAKEEKMHSLRWRILELAYFSLLL